MAPSIRTIPLRRRRRSSSPLEESNTINTPPLKPKIAYLAEETLSIMLRAKAKKRKSSIEYKFL